MPLSAGGTGVISGSDLEVKEDKYGAQVSESMGARAVEPRGLNLRFVQVTWRPQVN